MKLLLKSHKQYGYVSQIATNPRLLTANNEFTISPMTLWGVENQLRRLLEDKGFEHMEFPMNALTLLAQYINEGYKDNKLLLTAAALLIASRPETLDEIFKLLTEEDDYADAWAREVNGRS